MRQFLLCGAAAAALALSGCNQPSNAAAGAKAPANAAEFLAGAEKELSDFSDYASRVAWVNANFITDDTDWLNAHAGSEGTLLQVRLANDTKKYANAKLTPDEQRKMQILRAGIVMPAPSAGTPEDQKKIADELATITTDLQSTYGKGKFTIDGKELNLEQLSEIIAKSRDPKKLQQAWEGWHT
ncbi:MAG TPA: M2 family metallopeptidase, partial [Hyphomonadaceae bacterium]|nr:M2 family metallopeptidase [Hyphomonadaceae bacterium]